jgi:hypothetical protein
MEPLVGVRSPEEKDAESAREKAKDEEAGTDKGAGEGRGLAAVGLEFQSEEHHARGLASEA